MHLYMMFCSRMFAKDTMTLPAYIGLDTMGGYALDDQLIGFLNYGSFYKVKDDAGRFTDGYAPVDDDKANSFVMPGGLYGREHAEHLRRCGYGGLELYR